MSAELDTLIAERGNLTKLFGLLKPIASQPMPPHRLNALIEYFRFKDIGLGGKVAEKVQPDHFYAGPYNSYQDWFTRDLTESMRQQISSGLNSDSVIIPNECVIESVGTLGDTSSIIRLKKPTAGVCEDLIKLGVPSNYAFINMKLLTGHYHHVRSPISGVIKQALPIHAEYPLFGRSSLNFLEIDRGDISAFMLIVGEAVVQDFDYKVQVGDSVNVFDDLGNFTWGSQTVLLFPADVEDIIVGKRQYCFAGNRAT